MREVSWCLILCCSYCAACKVVLKPHFTGNLVNLAVDGDTWLTESDAFITYKGNKLSVSDKTLKFIINFTDVGLDSLGNWTEQVWVYGSPDLPKTVLMEVVVRNYAAQNAVILRQTFPSGVPRTSVGDKNKVCSGFPSWVVDPKYDLGFLAYGGSMFGETGRTVGRWNTASKNITSGLDSGPIVLFDKTGRSLVLSSYHNHMAGSTVFNDAPENCTRMTFGLLGMAEEIPKYFSYSVIAVVDYGINRAMERWGEIMRLNSNKPLTYRESDFVSNYIGYWTDKGAYYYYNTELNRTYEQTILDVYVYAQKEKIPYRYVQYDSWWYPKGAGGCTNEWLPMSTVFPHGINYLWNKTGWASIAHNRCWSSTTKYAKSNGGKWKFIVETSTNHSIPVDPHFWDNLLKTSKEWGLLTYEQDWLIDEFESMHVTQTNLNLGRIWLQQMGSGAERNGMTIQYCEAPSRFALQSLEIPVITQARVSSDYQPGNDQWKIGVSSIMCDQLGVAPFKDTFWTTTIQSGDPYGETEPYPELQSLVATLSTGPVGPSDKIGCSNVSLILKSCNSGGLILKPSRPARAIDKQIMDTAYETFQGELWSTFSIINGHPFFFGIIFGADFKDNITVTPKDAGFSTQEAFPRSKVFSARNPSVMMDFSSESPLKLNNCSKVNFCLYYTSPVLTLHGQEVVLLGDLTKWVPMSHKRVTYITASYYDVAVTVTGGVNEHISFSFFYDSKVYSLPCKMSSFGTAFVSIAAMTCHSEK